MNISDYIWDLKYRFKNQDGTPIDETPDHTWMRVAVALASAESIGDQDKMRQEFYKIMRLGYFSPAGRIISGAGTGRAVTLFNCYVMGTIPDSMNGIFEMLKEAALTMQQGGGIGYDFSTIRPKGSPVVHVGADASGPLSFMDVWDAMCRTVMSAGSRRGAMMATMRCDHPDIEDFIVAKQNAAKLRMFNLSVLVTDEFMEAVKNNDIWVLKHVKPPADNQGQVEGLYFHKTLQARQLWDLIMRSTYDAAEPGVIFIDRINQLNNLNYCETIAATNPCGEQPLPPYGACLLGSINLAKLIRGPFTKGAELDKQMLMDVVKYSVRMLDNAIDISKFPLERQREEAFDKRRIGLGIMGLADALLMLGIEYGSEESLQWLDQVMDTISEVAYRSSADLAQEKGSFPMYDPAKYLGGNTFVGRRSRPLKDYITEQGMRNSHLISIAPTGTISLFAGNVSSGIEPIFAAEYTRKVLQPDGSKTEEIVIDYAVAEWRRLGNKGLPPAYVDAQTLSPSAHLNMQATAQQYVDTSISKTINLPEDISFDDFKQVYLDAYELGCKGCTTYRPNAITGSVLSVKPEPSTPTPPTLIERPMVLGASAYKIKFGDKDAVYAIISDLERDGVMKPFELFLNSKDVSHQAWMTTVSRLISAIFRTSSDASFLIEELRAIHDPKGGGFLNGRYVPSMQAAIGDVIAQHMNMTTSSSSTPTGAQCEKCKEYTAVMKEGCMTCTSCGYSKCD